MGLWSVGQPICRSGTPSPQGGELPEEPAGQALLERLKLSAPIHAGLRLGEGTGGVLLLPMLTGRLRFITVPISSTNYQWKNIRPLPEFAP